MSAYFGHPQPLEPLEEFPIIRSTNMAAVQISEFQVTVATIRGQWVIKKRRFRFMAVHNGNNVLKAVHIGCCKLCTNHPVGYQDVIVIKGVLRFLYSKSFICALLARTSERLKLCQGLWKLLVLALPPVTLLIRKRIYVAATGRKFCSLL